MDPLTHTLTGATMADALGRRRTPLAAPTLIIGANLPDIDALTYFLDPNTSLALRRGWTHGILAMALLPLLLTAAMVLYDRRRRRRGHQGPAAVPRQLLLLAYIGVLSHPALDWLNTYGVRLLMPFDGSWFYGDTLFIIEPWLWLVLGGTCFLLHSRTRRGLVGWAVLGLLTSFLVLSGSAGFPLARVVWIVGLAILIALRFRGAIESPKAARWARTALATAGAYVLLMLGGTVGARQQIRAELPNRDLGPIEDVFVGPVAVNPFERAVVIQTPTAYHLGTFRWLDEPRWVLRPETLAPPPATPEVEAALGSRCVHGMVTWMRYPWVEVDATDDGFVIHLMDARYATRRTAGFGGSSVRLDPELRDHCDD